MRIPARLTTFTLYNGRQITTRSLLEARWASFFSRISVSWEYEPTVHEWKPDFMIEGFGYVEIKPTLPLFISESSEKLRKSAMKSSDRFWAFIGNSITFDCVALYDGKTIFAPTWRQTIDCLKPDGSIEISSAIAAASQEKFDHFVSVSSVMALSNALPREADAFRKEQNR